MVCVLQEYNLCPHEDCKVMKSVHLTNINSKLHSMRLLRRFNMVDKALLKQYFYISLDNANIFFMCFVAGGYDHFRETYYLHLREKFL
jgi:hypothetical protein